MKLFGMKLFEGKQSATSSISALSASNERSSGLKEPVDTVSHATLNDNTDIPNMQGMNKPASGGSDEKGTTSPTGNAPDLIPFNANMFAGIPVSSGSPATTAPGNIPPGFPPLAPSSNIPSSLSGKNGLSIYLGIPPGGIAGGAVTGAIGGLMGGARIGSGAVGAAVGAAAGAAGWGAVLKNFGPDFKFEDLSEKTRLAKKEEEAKAQIKEMVDSLGNPQSQGEQKIVESETHVSIGGVLLKKQK